MSQAPGWYRDPFFRGQERYWDGRMWTQGARPEGAEATEDTDPSSEEQPPASDAANDAMSRLSAALGEPAAAGAGAAAAAAAEAQSFAPLGAASQPVFAAAPAVGSGAWAPPAVGTTGPQKEGREGSRRGAVFAVAAAALLLVAGGVSAALVLGGSSNASAQEALASAAAQTINTQSADMSMSIDVSVMGQHETVSGNGAFDFAHKTGTMTITIPVNGTQLSEQEIIDGSTVYVNVSGLGSGLLSPSKPWISENLGQFDTSSGLGTLDPTSMLQQLQSVGGTVTSLGPTNYDGTAVTEYAATLPASALQGEIGKLPASLRQGVSGLNLPDMHMNIYVTGDNLLKAIELPSYSASASGLTMSMDMKMVLSNYGTTVNVTPPPADQVEPFSQLGGGLGNSGSTGNSGSLF